MKKDELILMAQTSARMGLLPKGYEVWKKAFALYNKDQSNRMLSPNCMSCYGTVFAYHLNLAIPGDHTEQ